MIHTKVAKIISPSVVVLAAGSEQGVQEGMEFIIYKLSDEILDPETSESLGRLELHKGTVKVYHVQPKMCLASTRARWANSPQLHEAFRSVVAFEELNVDKTQLGHSPDLVVRVGDAARSTSNVPALVGTATS